MFRELNMKHCERSQRCDSSIIVAIEGRKIDFSVDLCRHWLVTYKNDSCVDTFGMARRRVFLEALTGLERRQQD